MTLSRQRLDALGSRYRALTLVVAGDFCLDRYFEIDPARAETSLETGLPVRNVARTRCQPGAAGTVLNNLAALGIGRLELIGCCGEDGEGFELRRALAALPGVGLDGFLSARERATFCYTKPLVINQGKPPRELERIDIKNWTPTPPALASELARRFLAAARAADGVVVMEQVDHAGVGVVTDHLLAALATLAQERPHLPIVCDSRVGLARYGAVIAKMNAGELARMLGQAPTTDMATLRAQVAEIAQRRQRAAVVTAAEHGLVASSASGETIHVPALPVRGPIDVVGAGDSVSASLAAALSGGASLHEACALAMAAASVVIHKLATTGTADMAEISAVLNRTIAPGRHGSGD
jgi:rfaE bifunctional protein kinase chain/domain